MSIGEWLPLIVPLVVIQLFLMAIALVDLFKEERRVRGGNKPMWALIIVFGELLGPLAYFFLAREDV